MSFLLLETFPAFPIRSGTFAVFTVPLLGRFVQAVPAPICSKFRGTPAPTCGKAWFFGHRGLLPRFPRRKDRPHPRTTLLPLKTKRPGPFRPALSAVKICEISSSPPLPHPPLPKKSQVLWEVLGSPVLRPLAKGRGEAAAIVVFFLLYAILSSNRQRGKPCGRNGRPPGAPLWDGQYGGAYKGDRRT